MVVQRRNTEVIKVKALNSVTGILKFGLESCASPLIENQLHISLKNIATLLNVDVTIVDAYIDKVYEQKVALQLAGKAPYLHMLVAYNVRNDIAASDDDLFNVQLVEEVIKLMRTHGVYTLPAKVDCTWTCPSTMKTSIQPHISNAAYDAGVYWKKGDVFEEPTLSMVQLKHGRTSVKHAPAMFPVFARDIPQWVSYKERGWILSRLMMSDVLMGCSFENEYDIPLVAKGDVEIAYFTKCVFNTVMYAVFGMSPKAFRSSRMDPSLPNYAMTTKSGDVRKALTTDVCNWMTPDEQRKVDAVITNCACRITTHLALIGKLTLLKALKLVTHECAIMSDFLPVPPDNWMECENTVINTMVDRDNTRPDAEADCILYLKLRHVKQSLTAEQAVELKDVTARIISDIIAPLTSDGYLVDTVPRRIGNAKLYVA